VDPAAIRKPPKVEEQELEILTADQIAEVRTKLAGHTLLPIVELALATGMRRGELLALQWSDIDLDRACFASSGRSRRPEPVFG
jgi:integrase